MPNLNPNNFGSNPVSLKWNVVRGDTSKLRVDFLLNDEVTPFDTTGWTYLSSTYDFKGDIIDELTVESGEGYVIIKALPDITSYWGTGYSGTVAELAFDLQVSVDGSTVWTPVIGTISVMADITGSL